MERQDSTESGWTDDCVRVMQSESLWTASAGLLLAHLPALPTFKVYSSIPIEVHVSDNFLYVSVSHLMAQELPHGLSQLTGAYLPITIGVKLQREEEGDRATTWRPWRPAATDLRQRSFLSLSVPLSSMSLLCPSSLPWPSSHHRTWLHILCPPLPPTDPHPPLERHLAVPLRQSYLLSLPGVSAPLAPRSHQNPHGHPLGQEEGAGSPLRHPFPISTEAGAGMANPFPICLLEFRGINKGQRRTER